MQKRVLLVEPESSIRTGLHESIRAMADVYEKARFECARRLLASTPFDFVVSNIRLGPYNGLHLVHLSFSAGVRPRCIVYTAERDESLAREVRRAGAFYDTADCVPITLAAHLRGSVPTADRRNASAPDRRTTPRGGRRCLDVPLLRLA
jgi:DNA-binding NarL/FixJ family response regulator